MTGLESILAQITGDAAQEAEKLLAQGRQEAAASLDTAKAEAEKKSRRSWTRGRPGPWPSGSGPPPPPS